MRISKLRQLIREALEDQVKECPASTQDVLHQNQLEIKMVF
jgi:hypothetical protein